MLQTLIILLVVIWTTTISPASTQVCKGATPGIACDATCRNVGVCTANPNGSGLSWSLLTPCGNQYCNTTTGGCSATISSCNPGGDITCGVEGHFPDPYNCKGAFICDKPPAEPKQEIDCPTNLAYDACTGDCDKSLPNDLCPSVTVCSAVGESKVVPDNHRMYYVCLPDANGNIIPTMMKCTAGYFYDENLRLCVLSSTGGCGGGVVNPPHCDYVGQILPHPTNCAAYYYCDSNLTPVQRDCSPGFHFDASQGACVLGAC